MGENEKTASAIQISLGTKLKGKKIKGQITRRDIDNLCVENCKARVLKKTLEAQIFHAFKEIEKNKKEFSNKINFLTFPACF